MKSDLVTDIHAVTKSCTGTCTDALFKFPSPIFSARLSRGSAANVSSDSSRALVLDPALSHSCFKVNAQRLSILMNISSDARLQRNAFFYALSVKQSVAVLQKQLEKVVQLYCLKPCVVFLGRSLFNLRKKNRAVELICTFHSIRGRWTLNILKSCQHYRWGNHIL